MCFWLYVSLLPTQRITITIFWITNDLSLNSFYQWKLSPCRSTILHDDLNTDFSLHSSLRTFTMTYAIVILCLNVSFAELSKQLFFQLLSYNIVTFVVLFYSSHNILFVESESERHTLQFVIVTRWVGGEWVSLFLSIFFNDPLP